MCLNATLSTSAVQEGDTGGVLQPIAVFSKVLHRLYFPTDTLGTLEEFITGFFPPSKAHLAVFNTS